MEEIVIYKSPSKAVKIFAYTIPFVIIGLLMITKEDTSVINKVVGWVSICFFGLGIPVGFFQLLDRRPQIIINETGVYDRTAHKDFINWEIIQDAYLIDVQGQKLISLVVDENFKPSKTRGWFYKSIVRLNEEYGVQELNIHLGQIKIDEIRFTVFIKAMTKLERPENENIIKTLPNKV